MSLLQEKQGTMLMPVVAFSFPPQRGVVKKVNFLSSATRSTATAVRRI